MKIRENKFAVCVTHQDMDSVTGICDKRRIVGPGDLAVQFARDMIRQVNWNEAKPHEFPDLHLGIAHSACEVAQHLWNDFEQRGWLLNVEAPESQDQESQDQESPQQEGSMSESVASALPRLKKKYMDSDTGDGQDVPDELRG